MQRLEVAPDHDGSVYFHNVRVNGILAAADGPSLWQLTVLLNARLLDYVFRRGAAVHANGYFAANKQFIAPLPIRIPGGEIASSLDLLGQRLHERAKQLGLERAGFHRWLEGELGAQIAGLTGKTKLLAYDQIEFDEWLAALRSNAARLAIDPATRAFRERAESEWASSRERLSELARAQAADEQEADRITFELYELPAAQRALVDSEYDS